MDIRLVLPDGKRHRRRFKAPVSSKTAAQRWGEERERVLYHELTHPEPERKEVPTLQEFAPRFVEQYLRANRHKPSGIEGNESVLRTHLVPVLGAKKLDAVTSEDVQGLKSRLLDRSPKTVNNVLSVLSVMLKTAVDWSLIDRVPCTVRLLPIPKTSIGFDDFEEYDRLVLAATEIDANTHLVVLLGGEAGLRCGEMIALEWSDLDLRRQPPQICIQRSDWRGHVTAPKNGRIRFVPLASRVAAALRAHRHLRGARVLCQRNGFPLTHNMVWECVSRAARRAGLTSRGVHRLRHTFCSHLAMLGAPVRAIQELAGHQNLTTTQRYMHLSPAAVDGAVKLLDRGKSTPGFGDMLETAEGGTGKSLN